MIENDVEGIVTIICSETDLKDRLSEAVSSQNGNLCLQIEVNRGDRQSIFYRIEGDACNPNVLILYNGAYSGTVERKNQPVFQRCTWVSDFGCLVINIDDPTIRLGKDCVIGWGQGTLEDYYSLAFNKFLKEIYLCLGVEETRNKIHFGSSAGGYQAIVGASLDRGSRAIVCNPQVDWTNHFLTSHVDRLRNVCFKGFSIAAIKAMYPERANCMVFARRNRNIPSVDFYVNAQFAHDIRHQLTCFVDVLGAAESVDLLQDRDFEIYVTHASRGHNPPGKDDTIKYIQRRFV